MQLREADAHALVELHVERCELERGLAQAVAVRAHVIGGHRLRAGGLHQVAFGRTDDRSGRLVPCGVRRQRELHAQRLVDAQHGPPRHRDARLERVILEGGFGAAHAEHAVALPHWAIGGNAHVALRIERHLVERVGEVPLVRPEFQHVAGRERTLGRDGGGAVLRRQHAPHEHAAVVRAAVAHDVVAALVFQVGRGEAARERLGQRGMLVVGSPHGLAALLGPLGQRPVEHGAVRLRDREHVLGRLHAALDLERGHTRVHELRKQVDGAQVLRGQQVLAGGRKVLAQRHVVQRVGQTARLRAQPAVRRAAADERRHEALPRIAHAQRSVGERLHFHAETVRDLGEVGDLGHG